MKTNIQEADAGDAMVEVPQEIMQALGLRLGDLLDVSIQEGDSGHVLVLAPIYCPNEYTVIADRFHGAYSGAEYIAWPLPSAAIPSDSQGGDVEASLFWSQPRLAGKGETADAALADLKRLLAQEGLGT